MDQDIRPFGDMRKRAMDASVTSHNCLPTIYNTKIRTAAAAWSHSLDWVHLLTRYKTLNVPLASPLRLRSFWAIDVRY